MKSLATLGVAALVSLGLAAPASAYKFSPKNTNFTASGPTKLTKKTLTVPCTTTLHGSTDALGVGHIKTATFTGSSVCTGIRATGLPWTVKATTASSSVTYNVAVTAAIFGTCGPGDVPTAVSKTGVFTFSNVLLKPDCKVNGTISSNPKVTIVP